MAFVYTFFYVPLSKNKCVASFFSSSSLSALIIIYCCHFMHFYCIAQSHFYSDSFSPARFICLFLLLQLFCALAQKNQPTLVCTIYICSFSYLKISVFTLIVLGARAPLFLPSLFFQVRFLPFSNYLMLTLLLLLVFSELCIFFCFSLFRFLFLSLSPRFFGTQCVSLCSVGCGCYSCDCCRT